MNGKKIFAMLLACAWFVSFAGAASAESGTVGQDIKQDAKATGKGISNGARDIGHGTAHAARTVGHGTANAAKSVGHGAAQVGHGIAHGTREGWDATKSAVKQVFHKGD
jgi:hypothetical protein